VHNKNSLLHVLSFLARENAAGTVVITKQCMRIAYHDQHKDVGAEIQILLFAPPSAHLFTMVSQRRSCCVALLIGASSLSVKAFTAPAPRFLTTSRTCVTRSAARATVLRSSSYLDSLSASNDDKKSGKAAGSSSSYLDSLSVSNDDKKSGNAPPNTTYLASLSISNNEKKGERRKVSRTSQMIHVPKKRSLVEKLTQAFPLWVLAAALIGLAKPASFAWFTGDCITAALATTMLFMGTTLRIEDFKAIAKQPKPVAVGTALQYTGAVHDQANTLLCCA
jgi:hypothetical protein